MLQEFRPLMKLAGPVILAEVGWMSMGLVDTIMVGPLGPAAIAATGMGSGVFTAIVIFGMGLDAGSWMRSSRRRMAQATSANVASGSIRASGSRAALRLSPWC